MKLARRGNFRLQLHDDDQNRIYLRDDYIARLWYKNIEYGIDWTNIFNGIIKTPSRDWYSNGNKLAIFYGSDSNELLDKALVMYPTTAPQSDKTGVATDVMKEFVEENIGVLATTGNGRRIDHVNPITITFPNPGIGPVWTGNESSDVLIKALQDVRDFTLEQGDRIDFNVIYSGSYTWEVQIGKLFVDRTINGLDQTTGLNGVGNVPVILSPRYKNVKQYTEATPRVQESNVVLALGQRVGDDREYVVATSAASIAKSPIAQRESLVQTQNQADIADYAESELRARVGVPSVLIEPEFTPSFSIFKDLWPGDFFTVVSLDGEPFNKQVVELKLVVRQTLGGRTITQYTMFTEDREP